MKTLASPEQILGGLNSEQRAAAESVSGPLVILAGAGSGKTRVISHRVAYAVATSAVDERQVLVVSFTTKAAGEMAERLRGFGLRRAKASTLHAAALAQLQYFWPLKRGAPLPRLMPSKVRVLGPLARALPGNHRYRPAKDLASEIEWAKNRRISPAKYIERAERERRDPPLPVDLMSQVYADYETAKGRSGWMDFEDLLEEAIRLYREDESAAGIVRRRYGWFSVDEYQDTNPLQQALIEAWLGDRDDIAVVGDPNQTIYSFTGATPEYLIGFRQRYPDARTVTLDQNYRSTPEILELANRLVADGVGPRLRATSSPGPTPKIVRAVNDESELELIVREIERCVADGTPLTAIAVLARMNYQLEAVAMRLRTDGIAFRFQGTPFYRTPDVRAAITALGTSAIGGVDLRDHALRAWLPLGFEPEATTDSAEAAQRQLAMETLFAIVERFAADNRGASARDLVAEFERRAAVEADEAASGVTLSTIHGAKGLEWPVVIVPMLEEGSVPIRHAFGSTEAIAEERRLLYVAITRAARRLTLSWAASRTSGFGVTTKQTPSRFLAELELPKPPRKRAHPPRKHTASPRVVPTNQIRKHTPQPATRRDGYLTTLEVRRPVDRQAEAAREAEQDRFNRLAEWRRNRARRDGVPAHMVAADADLRAIAKAGPTSLATLQILPGMGPARVERYGSEILEALAR